MLSEHPAVRGLDPPSSLATDELHALRAGGYPWRALGNLSDVIEGYEAQGLGTLALELLVPDSGLSGKLFHLGICGEVVFALQELGSVVDSVRPIGHGRSSIRPAFRAPLGGVVWEIWFESAAIWKASGLQQPYLQATGALLRNPRSLSADVPLIDRAGRRALLLECKDSFDPTYVGRSGYHQATTYLIECHGRLSDETAALTAGHSGAVTGLSGTELGGEFVGLVEADALANAVENFVLEQPFEVTQTAASP